MEIKVNLTLKQIYEVICPECKEKVLELAAQNTNMETIKDSLKAQFEKPD